MFEVAVLLARVITIVASIHVIAVITWSAIANGNQSWYSTSQRRLVSGILGTFVAIGSANVYAILEGSMVALGTWLFPIAGALMSWGLFPLWRGEPMLRNTKRPTERG